MTLDEFKDALFDVEMSLRQPEVEYYFTKGPGKEQSGRFIEHRKEVARLRDDVKDKQLGNFVQEFEKLSQDLKKGKEEMDDKLNALQDAVSTLETIGEVVSIAATMAKLLV